MCIIEGLKIELNGRNMKIISVLNAKGGVAKTTSSLALADYLSKSHKVLFLDLDPQANATSTLLNLDIGQEAEEPTLSDTIHDFVMRQKHSIKKSIRPADLGNLDMSPAHLDLEPYKDFFKQKLPRPDRLIAEILKPVKKDYDFVICDCPADISLYVESAISASDLCLVPTTYDLYGFKALQILLKVMFSIHDSDYDRFRVLYTRVKSSATKIQQEMSSYIEIFEKRGVVLPYRIPEEQSVTNAQARHHSLMLNSAYKNSTARKRYEDVGEFIKEYCHV